MNKVNYHFNPSSYRLIISYAGTTHKTRIERAYVHQFKDDGYLNKDTHLKRCTGWVIIDENGKIIKKG